MLSFIVLLICIGPLTVQSLRCYQCSFISSPSACSHQAVCSTDEQCFVEKRFDGNGKEYYNMGCVSATFCQNIDNDMIVGKKKRNTESVDLGRYKRDSGCLKCCSTDNCNSYPCENPDVPVRLVDGNNTHQGTVEVYYNNRWGTVCDDGWTEKQAKVVCNWMGYSSDMAVAVQGNGFHYSGNETFLLDEVVCSGNESSLMQCTHAPWSVSNCQPGEEAGVLCPEALFPAHDIIYFLDKASHKIIRMNVQLLTYSYLNIENVLRPQSFDYDPINDVFYFYDDHLKQILYMKSDGTDLRVVLQLDYSSRTRGVLLNNTLDGTLNGRKKINTGINLKIAITGSILKYTMLNMIHIMTGFKYSDKGLNVIAVISVKGGTPSYLIQTNLNSPSGIAVDSRPNMLKLYWTDWGLHPKIEVSNLYSAGDRRTLVDSGIVWPNSLAIDFQENRLYFADGGTEKIESIDFSGSNRKVHKQDNVHILSVDLIGNDIYYTAINGGTPFRVKKDGSNPISIGHQSFSELTEIIGYKLGTDNFGQPMNPTSTKFFLRLMGNNDASRGPIEVFINGQWRTICNINWDDQAAKVVCNMLGYDRLQFDNVPPNGCVRHTLFKAVAANYPMEGSVNMNTLKCSGNEDSIVSCHFTPQDWYLHECSTNFKAGVLCEEADPNLAPDYRIDNFLIFMNASTGGLVRMDLNTFSYTVSQMTSLDQFIPMAVAYDTYYQHFYVSHVNHATNTSTITVYNTRGAVVATVNNIPAGSVINGLALDTRRSTLYFSDAGNNVIGSISTLGSDLRMIARNITRPGGIALDKNRLVVFWTEGGATPKIVRANHDGSSLQVIVSTGLSDPRGIAVDPAAGRLYYCNTGLNRIEYTSVSGTSGTNLYTDILAQPQGITITSRYIFYTDLNKRKIMLIDKSGGNPTPIGADDFSGVYDIYAYESFFS